MSYIGSFLSQVWRLFSVPWPGVGLTAAEVALGIFVVVLSINIVQGLLSLVGVISGSVSSAAGSARAKSYRTYARGRARAEKYEARYSHAKKAAAKKENDK